MPAVLARLPERQPPRRPFLLHAPVERIVEVRRVAEGELPAAEEDPAEAGDDQDREDDQPETRPSLHQHPRPAAKPARVFGMLRASSGPSSGRTGRTCPLDIDHDRSSPTAPAP